MNTLTIDKDTILKYDKPGPRYTSYPTAPEWTAEVTAQVYKEKLRQFGQSSKTLSLYIHLPFCQSMCYFCACTTIIRKRDDKYGDEYLEYLFKEIELVRQSIGARKKVRQFHWGGGTPTFLTERQIEKLFRKVTEHFDIDFDGEVAIEIDPRTIDQSKMQTLRRLGFNRVSMGIQDFDGEVQKQVNRLQPYKIVKNFFDWCRELKFQSINCDLIYGLPGQTPKQFGETIDKVIDLKPERIALYSFAYVPWLKKHQSRLDAQKLPTNDQKLDIFLQSRNQFLNAGYQAIAMDHFALKTDEMAQAFNKGALHRNFMGYTVKPADEFIGLGMSAIGFLEDTFVQNHKTINDYYKPLKEGILPVEHGKVLTEDDRMRQWAINALMCRFQIDKNAFQKKFKNNFDEYFSYEAPHIGQCVKEGLLTTQGEFINVTELGRIFIRNVCMGFDWYLRQPKSHRRFSRTV